MGKRYYINGKLKFQGEYLFNKKYIGKFYDIDGNIKFELNNKNNNKITIKEKEQKTFIFFQRFIWDKK